MTSLKQPNKQALESKLQVGVRLKRLNNLNNDVSIMPLPEQEDEGEEANTDIRTKTIKKKKEM